MPGPFGGMDGPFITFKEAANFVIMPIADDGRENDDYGGAKILQYWPQSIQTSRSANWVPKVSPGLAIPLKQWTGGGESIVTFTAVFSCDMDGDVEEDKFNVDVEAAIKWLEMLTLPTYVSVGDTKVAHAPPVIWLYAPKVELGSNAAAEEELGGVAAFTGDSVPSFDPSGIVGNTLNNNGMGIYVNLNNVDAERGAFFVSGKTRYATVNLNFSETIQIAGNIFPYDATALKGVVSRYKKKP